MMNITDILTVSSIITLAVSSALYVWQDKKKLKQQEFENYFKLISEFSKPSGHWAEKVFLLHQLAKYRENKHITKVLLENAEHLFRFGEETHKLIIKQEVDKILQQFAK